MIATQIEARVEAVWKEMLNVEGIAPDQSFFEAGGDSLLMIDMLFRLNSELGVEIDPGFLFEDPTLHGFSALIAASQESYEPAETGAI